MTSKWITNLEDVYADGGEWEDFLPILLEIESLLKRAMNSVDDENLYDEIMKEL